MTEWYEESFQEDYLRIYDHRDEQKAARELEALMSYIPLQKKMTVLDLCCGHGRHCRWLARRDFDVTGVDLSAVLLKKAIDLTSDLPIKYMRADVRNIQFSNEYDAVFNLFTSFGYFPDDEENELVFKNAYQALKPGGWFLFDYLNPQYVTKNLVAEDESNKDGLHIRQQRKIDKGFVTKTITIHDNESKREYLERVKLYSSDELKRMLESSGFTIQSHFGDYDASPYQTATSPRQIFICHKEK
ncbi:bifunctional 2-polyprenyl-6-hydroxyphenol methylase/3-demethylubiquinol 3-O-methyltransferase UbiG [Thalassobacillus sp. C254]|uniref:class I SAM-dependent methyltransferase n=1 Tax=Thalassobacillus sp. C254 TaxID=1225341 RepID=UPI0006D101C9|nr:class I SAM-dependent methyltransferase [Thalassobacillus sp. C254]